MLWTTIANACCAQDALAREKDELPGVFEQAGYRNLNMVNRSLDLPLPALRVLVVDDDEITRMIVRRLLPSPPMQIETAANGRAALDAFAARRPDAVVMDLDMPVMGGLEAAARMRALEWETTPESGRAPCLLIALSSFEDEATRARCIAQGFDGYLVKPVTPETLRAALARVPGDRPARPAEIMPAPAPQPQLRPQDPVHIDADLHATLPRFFASRRALLDELSLALAQADGARTRALAHKLAGSLALYGFHWAANQGKMIEKRAGEGRLAGLEVQVADLRSHLDGVEAMHGNQ